jgi:hypothetical protein
MLEELKQESFFSNEQKENFGKAVTMLLLGSILYIFGNMFHNVNNQPALNNIIEAFGWVGFGLIMSSIIFASWKFRSGLFPMFFGDVVKNTDTLKYPDKK